MNSTNAKDYLPLIQALAESKTIQFKFHDDVWRDVDEVIPQSYTLDRYRIKPEPKKGWYRVALWAGGLGRRMVTLAISDYEEKQSEEQRDFVRWLTDRIEYELPEGDV